MSSWFDTKYLGSLAKTAIAEAQKTLDKALDIKEEDQLSPSSENSVSGLVKPSDGAFQEKTKTAGLVKSISGAGGWGSFTGSFFEASELDKRSQHSVPLNSSENKSRMVSSTSEPVSLQPSAKPSHFAEVECTDLQKSSSSSIMEASCDEEILDLELNSQITFSNPSVITEDVTPVDSSVVLVVETTTNELETSSQTLVSGAVERSSLSTVSSASGLMSSMTDDSEDLNSSVSSSLTFVAVSSNAEQDATSTATLSCDIEEDKSTIAETIVSTMLDEIICQAEEEGDKEVYLEVPKPVAVTSDSPNSEFSNCDESPDENNLTHASCRAESESGSSRSFELLRMPQSTMDKSSKTEKSGNGSGHTSGDDLETFTTTSSDIEVISSPGYSEKSGMAGGSPVSLTKRGRADGANNSKNFTKGHIRTHSELSSVSCHSENLDSSEMERLQKKIFELSEILEARETKMVELSRANHELQEQNVDLTSQIREAMRINSKMTETTVTVEEFTQRMAAMEKKLQQITAEKDSLKEENKVLKKERLCQNELSDLLAEKDEIISDLRAEGESLSKQAGKHSEIIKKLRSKEKTLEKDLTTTKSNLESKIQECDRLKKSLSAKDEMESKQIEAIRELTSANSKWEEANNKMASELEDAHEKITGLKLSLETTYKEIGDLKRGLIERDDEAREAELKKEIEARERVEKQSRDDLENFRLERDALCRDIDELRVALSAAERAAARHEDEMRREVSELQQRLEHSEHRHEELSGSVSLATRPLLRQIESLQSSLSETRLNSDRIEQSLTERLQQTSIQLAAAQDRERTVADHYRQASARVAALESQVSTLMKTKSQLEVQLESESRRVRVLEEQLVKESSVTDALKKSFAEEISELKKEKEIFEASLENEKTLVAAEQRKNMLLAQQLKERDRRIKEVQSELDLSRSAGFEPRFSEKSSPTPSLSQLSFGGSFSESAWPEEVFHSLSGQPGFTPGQVYETGRAAGGSTAALLESLQAQLKQREGEIIQLQMEVSGLERVKESLTQELGRLSQKSDRLEQLEEEMSTLKARYAKTETEYATLLTMYGEKVEEVEELRLDLQDVKEAYKSQIEEVLKQKNS